MLNFVKKMSFYKIRNLEDIFLYFMEHVLMAKEIGLKFLINTQKRAKKNWIAISFQFV